VHTIYYSENAKIDNFANRLKRSHCVFYPEVKSCEPSKETDYSYKKFNHQQHLVFNPYRTIEPLKAFFTYPCEKVAEYFISEKEVVLPSVKAVVIGVKACDLAGHKVQDFVFLEGVEVDALYRIRRENTVLISSDCTDFKKVCHCLAWEIMPYPLDGFDLNLSPLNDGYLVEVGSKKGQELIEEFREFFTPAKETQIAARKVKREALVERLKRHLLPQNLVARNSVQRLMKQGYALDTWKQFMLPCVECGGCNLICDTCHCFLLSEKKAGAQHEKLRSWDGCLYANYARVAGGANPLKTRAQRLRNRFVKKFDFFVDNLGMPACCGCGRCIEVCPGKIDIREVLKDLDKKLAATS